MNKIIYYPGFEVKDVNWLKFALLYIEKLRPIIPSSAHEHLSDTHRKLFNETDLIEPYAPDYRVGKEASEEAILAIEKLLGEFKICRQFSFSARNAVPAFIKIWKRGENHKFLLFQDKYSSEWEKYCVKKKFCRYHPDGILLAEELAFLYMSILAQIVADSEGISSITDKSGYDNFTTTIRKSAKPCGLHDLAHSTLKLILPNFARVSLEDIIKFRNRRNFKCLLKAFNAELDQFYRNVVDRNNPQKFINSFEEVYREFLREIAKLGASVAYVSLGAWLNSGPHALETRDILQAVTWLGSGAFSISKPIITLRRKWQSTETKRFCRKYLMQLRQIPHRHHNFKEGQT